MWVCGCVGVCVLGLLNQDSPTHTPTHAHTDILIQHSNILNTLYRISVIRA